MIYAQPQSEGAVSQLASEIKNADSTKWYRRLKIVQLSMAGKPEGQLATEFDVCPGYRSELHQIVQQWRHRWVTSSQGLGSSAKDRSTQS